MSTSILGTLNVWWSQGLNKVCLPPAKFGYTTDTDTLAVNFVFPLFNLPVSKFISTVMDMWHASNLGSSAQQDFAVTLVTNWIFLALHGICPYWYYRKHLRRQAELIPTRPWGEVPWQRECPWMQYLGERTPNNSRCFTILMWWNHNEDHLTGIYRFHLFSQNMIWGYYRYLSMFAFVQSLQTLSLS